MLSTRHTSNNVLYYSIYSSSQQIVNNKTQSTQFYNQRAYGVTASGEMVLVRSPTIAQRFINS